MKLLFDEYISYRILNKIEKYFLDCSHVSLHSLNAANDKSVWTFAKENRYTIVTNDSDFNDFSLVWGFPPKVIWLRTGNTSTNHTVSLLIEKKKTINKFIKDETNGVLVFE